VSFYKQVLGFTGHDCGSNYSDCKRRISVKHLYKPELISSLLWRFVQLVKEKKMTGREIRMSTLWKEMSGQQKDSLFTFIANQISELYIPGDGSEKRLWKRLGLLFFESGFTSGEVQAKVADDWGRTHPILVTPDEYAKFKDGKNDKTNEAKEMAEESKEFNCIIPTGFLVQKINKTREHFKYLTTPQHYHAFLEGALFDDIGYLTRTLSCFITEKLRSESPAQIESLTKDSILFRNCDEKDTLIATYNKDTKEFQWVENMREETSISIAMEPPTAYSQFNMKYLKNKTPAWIEEEVPKMEWNEGAIEIGVINIYLCPPGDWTFNVSSSCTKEKIIQLCNFLRTPVPVETSSSSSSGAETSEFDKFKADLIAKIKSLHPTDGNLDLLHELSLAVDMHESSSLHTSSS
jgi:hypothetical protein